MIQMTICSGDPLGSEDANNLKVLSRPQLMLMNNQFGTIQFGRLKNLGTDQNTPNDLEKGCSANFTPLIQADKSIVLRIQTSVVEDEDPKNRKLWGIETTRMMKEDKPYKIRFSTKSATDQTWVEVSVKVINSAKDAQKKMEDARIK